MSRGALLLWTATLAAFGQTRDIVPEKTWESRKPTAQAAAAAKPVYRTVGGAARQPGARQIGVTIWRLRPARPDDAGGRILVQEAAATTELVPERVSSEGGLRAGDRVRVSIESPDAGYLYVIDRERYTSGERGEPWLIFPTARTRGGDNRVAAGKLIDIPGQADQPNFFTLRPGRKDQSEEELTVLLTKSPLPGVELQGSAVKLTNDQVAEWEKRWGAAAVDRFELSGGAGKVWTRAEQQAGAATRLLTQEDPAPQTVYRVASKPDEPVMVKVRLRYHTKP
jgi:hypothetical protein